MAAVASKLLAGASPEGLPFEVWTDTVPTFDARALARWGIDERLLPPQSVVRFKPQSVWQQYRLQMAIALIVILLEGLLIVALVVQQIRLRRAQRTVQQDQEFMDLASSAGGLGLWSRDTQTDELWVSSGMREPTVAPSDYRPAL